MSLKKLAAGSGYAYLTRQVAAADSTGLGSMPLADYYAAKGEAPGRWIGSGLVGIDRLGDGDVVTDQQMKNLFGDGCDPVTGAALGRAFQSGSVAGFDLTFSPVKSVSALWAVVPPEVARQIRRAHNAAVLDAVDFLESHAIFTREGTGGARQVETRGLIAAAFLHRDSRAGDPDLHTHVAVANKVQTRQGKWLSIYGTVLHQHVVAASEAYNTALEAHLREGLGVTFVDVPRAGGKRPVREISGVDAALCPRWSRRRSDIEDRRGELAEEFTLRHGRPPTAKESIALAQRANLETREAKHEPRSEAEQRATWHEQAVQELGPVGVDRMIRAALTPTPTRRPQVSSQWLAAAAERVITELEAHRATWQTWHIHAEAQRQLRGLDVPSDQVGEVVEHLVDAVTASLINLTPDRDPISDPAVLRRSDGTSVYRHTGADHFTSQRILDAEQRIVTAAGAITADAPDPIDIELALTQAELEGTRLNDGQRQLVQALASDPHRVVLALAPAGSGKTTAMSALAEVCADLGYRTIGLAPSAAAAAVLREATGMPTETLAKVDHLLGSDLDPGLDPQTVVIIDEAGMADTLTLDRVIASYGNAGAKVCLIGDDQQLAAIGAGGVLRDIATTHGATRLDEIVRFDDPVEAAASLDLRSGDRSALGFYFDHDRVHTGDADTCLSDVLAAFRNEAAAGRECLMLASTRDLVTRINHDARNARLAGAKPTDEVTLADGNQVSVGDTILTRRNDRRLGVSGTDWVKNGDRWSVVGINTDGSLRARHLHSGLRVNLPSEYVANHVELGYATTVHAAQGSSADVVHGIVTGTEDRQLLYTMLTRGRAENHVHVVLTQHQNEQFLPGIDEQLTAVEMLERIIDRDGAATSATTALSNATSAAARLHEAARRYADSLTIAATRHLGADADAVLEAAGPGPLPWLPGIPIDLRSEPRWFSYLHARADRVGNLAEEVRQHHDLPDSLARFKSVLPPAFQEQVAVWRAANGVRDDDRSLLGPRVANPGADAYARRLSRRVNDLYPPAVQRWEERIATAIGRPGHRDEHILDLARELDRLERNGHNAGLMLQRGAHDRRTLPDDHTVEALAYRIRRLAAHDPVGQAAPYRPSTPARGLGL
jgi:conjugative relaxase-like TrwC/TraI family protein